MLPTTPSLQERTDKELRRYCLALLFLGAGLAFFVVFVSAYWFEAASDLFIVLCGTASGVSLTAGSQALGAMNDIRSRINKETSRGVETP